MRSFRGLVVAAACVAVLPAAQEQALSPDPAKLDKYVRDACGKNPLVRLQATRRLVQAGPPGWLACQRFVAARGPNAMSADLVRALGKFDAPAARTLLRACATDAGFSWRPQALQALAERPRESETDLFEQRLTDRSWLLRRAALSGWQKLLRQRAVPTLRRALDDSDARVRVHAATLLLPFDEKLALPELLRGLQVEESFFGDDLGAFARQQAFRALREWAGDDFGYRARAPRARRQEAASSFAARVQAATGVEVFFPAAPKKRHWRLGFERRSCKDGDLYLRIDRNGDVYRGLFEPTRVEAPKELVESLLDAAMTVPARVPRRFGTIRCDFERYAGFGGNGRGSVRCEPGKVPPPLADVAGMIRRLQ